MYSVGLDVHQRRSSMHILDGNGKLVNRVQVDGPWPELMRAVDRLPRPFSVCFEASCGYGYLFEELSKRADRVAVAHPAQLRLIFRSKKKNDKVDAAKLATLLYLDQVPQVHVPEADVRAWREAVEWRGKLLEQRVKVKNRLKAVLRSRGLASAAPKSLWSKRGLAWLREQSLDECEQMRREMLTDELAEVNRRIALVEKHLAKVAASQPGVALLMTVPGVGVRTAEAFVAYVDEVRRFGRVNRVGSYFGLVPCQDASAEKGRLGHITKDGPATVRKLLCEASWQAVRRSRAVKARFERLCGGKPERRKIALVAVAHYLCRVMAAMLRSGECWREEPNKERKQES